jgi:hypothetical protein
LWWWWWWWYHWYMRGAKQAAPGITRCATGVGAALPLPKLQVALLASWPAGNNHRSSCMEPTVITRWDTTTK